MDTHNYLLWRKIADDHVFFRHPHPKIYKKIKKTINLANEGLNPAEFEERGGLSRYNFENFFYIIYERHKTLQKFLRVNKPYQLRKTKGNFKKEKNEPLKDNWNVLVLLVDFNDQEKITPVDYYHDLLLSENKVEYSVDDEDLWNIGDFVSVVVPEDAMVFESVSEDAE